MDSFHTDKTLLSFKYRHFYGIDGHIFLVLGKRYPQRVFHNAGLGVVVAQGLVAPFLPAGLGFYKDTILIYTF
jgi:hypothetical protein